MQDKQEPRKPEPDNKTGFDWRRHRGPIIWFALALLFLLVISVQGQGELSSAEEIDYTQMVNKINHGEVERIIVETGSVNIKIRGKYRTEGLPSGAPAAFTSITTSEMLAGLNELCANATPKVDIRFKEPSALLAVFLGILPYLLIFLLIYFLFFRQLRNMGGGGVLSFGKSRATRITRDKVKKTFADVAEVDEAKDEVFEIIEFLRNPEKFRALGGRLPHGCLLIGAPGTGKTLMAKAIAGEADVPFFSISGSDFVEMFVGVGASRVRDLFEHAKESAPCIIFLDEIDAVGRKRGTGFSGGHDEREQTLNAILVEMDGFATNESVIVMAATNRPDVLDPALLRPGRFDRRIYVDLPDLKGREDILKVHSRDITMTKDIDLQRLARGTPGFSGADLENIINEGALLAAMKNKKAVDMDDLEEARDKVRWGREKRSRVMTEEDRRITAYHEAGHALANVFLENVSPLHKVTIVQRGRALGATMQLPEKDEYNMSRKRIMSDLKMLLAGRVAEEIFCDDISSGASSDLERATGLVRAMVCEWGMSEAMGLVHYKDRRIVGGYGWGDVPTEGSISEATAEKIDLEIRRVIDECYVETKKLVEQHKQELQRIVDALLEFEVLSAEDVRELIAEDAIDSLREKKRLEKEQAKQEEAIKTVIEKSENINGDPAPAGEVFPFLENQGEEKDPEKPAE
ncbi:MAG: ATP-dependent zinc metalloprotease FtsH [Planctomycetes bacterium]|nr:ATP-dependent zinc metalloprotease FtsH [Planctomycetota bacterium]